MDCGGPWRTIEDHGGPGRTMEDRGGPWRTVEDQVGPWRTREDRPLPACCHTDTVPVAQDHISLELLTSISKSAVFVVFVQ